MRVIVPVAPFPDPAVRRLMAELGYVEVTNTVGTRDVIEEWCFESPGGATSVRYLLEPELAIPCIVVSGEEAAADLRARVPHFDPLAVAIAYNSSASGA